MERRPHSLIAYDASGNVVATLSYMVVKDDDDEPGLVDFAAHEEAGGRLREIWENSNAVGSAVWPEWLGGKVYQFTVELSPSPPGMARAHISALVHKKSGHRRSRADIEAAIAERINEKKADAKKRGDEMRAFLKKRGLPDELVAEFSDPPPEPADLRDLLGGPNRPLLLDEDGKTKPRTKVKRPDLPVVSRRR